VNAVGSCASRSADAGRSVQADLPAPAPINIIAPVTTRAKTGAVAEAGFGMPLDVRVVCQFVVAAHAHILSPPGARAAIVKAHKVDAARSGTPTSATGLASRQSERLRVAAHLFAEIVILKPSAGNR